MCDHPLPDDRIRRPRAALSAFRRMNVATSGNVIVFGKIKRPPAPAEMSVGYGIDSATLLNRVVGVDRLASVSR
jgi:hypothetical protein